MTFFRTWLFGIVAASMALSLVYALLPKGAMLTAAKCAGSLILILVMLRPLITLQIEDFSTSYDYWSQEIAEQSEGLAEENRREMEALIEAECAAYISEKGRELGVSAQAEVECEVRDGVPFPAAVTLDIPYHAVLSQSIAQDLGIAPTNQYWQEYEDAL